MFRSVVLAALVANLVLAVPDKTPVDVSNNLSTVSWRQRQLEDQQQQEDDISWLAGYSIVYEYCYHSQQSVSYKLCPLMASSYKMYGRNSCEVYDSGCATYMTDIVTFVESFTDAQMEARQYRCENAREGCDNENEGNCFQDDGLQYCQEDYNENMNLQAMLACQQFADGYFVGPWCGDDNMGIYLRVFTDNSCTTPADDNSAFFSTYGYELPYTTSSLVGAFGDATEQGDTNCASCMEHGKEEDKNHEDQYDQDEVLGECEFLYAYTYSKCETDLVIDYPDTSGCQDIEDLKKLEKVGSNKSSARKVALAFLFVALFAGGVAALAYHIKQKKEKSGTSREALI